MIGHEPQYVVSVGNPWDGIYLYGPFPSAAEANDWADHADACRNETWWVNEIERAQ